ncbi:hypothetical protein KUL25_04370 [Rhodobacteraceae bacterium N5(2021)]|uniref:Uncharacterized protein n=1 Tax=Gymnodinialimonas phycosphaerae TaxID=2841589 RepID=A0A975YGW5_9RHOB|nr:hypothetical protein [Gymnodinialimonas phycosphaerae]MBY4891997.1 hypothetical protein [Gymnodinialimonas phycosphaerae]
MIRVAPALVAFGLATAQVHADTDFCQTLSALQATAAVPEDGDVVFAFTDDTGALATCRRVLELGGARSLACNWAFAYRSDAAQAAFAALVSQVTSCRGAPLATDTPVNHPDSYDLLTFTDGISVALKDKAALQETHVILRVQG